MNTGAKKIVQKMTNVQKFMITEKKLHKTINNQKNWSAPGINRLQSFK